MGNTSITGLFQLLGTPPYIKLIIVVVTKITHSSFYVNNMSYVRIHLFTGNVIFRGSYL